MEFVKGERLMLGRTALRTGTGDFMHGHYEDVGRAPLGVRTDRRSDQSPLPSD
jgi:hypothetical protein